MQRTKALVLALAVLAGCRSCRQDEHAADAAAPDAGSERPKAAAPLAFEILSSPQGFGLPAGCHLEGPVKRAALPAGKVRFSAVRGALDDLALAVAERDGGAVSASAWLALDQHRAEPLWWTALDEPPALAKGDGGLVVARDRPASGSFRSVMVSRALEVEEKLADGDQLWVSDAACDGASCAVLTGLARKTVGPGATLFVGRAGEPASKWKRIDIEADPKAPWKPHSIVSIDGRTGVVWVALGLKKKIALYEVDGRRAELRGTVDTPHGSYDVVMASTPLVIAPGAPPDQPCARDEFPISVTPLGGEPVTLVTQAAPESVITRPLAGGAILLWVAPVSCRMTSRVVVHGALLAKDGKSAGSPMSIADATGFALATRGDALSMWLETQHKLSWLKARCAP